DFTSVTKFYFLQDDCLVPVDRNGFKQYDTLDALNMNKMMTEVDSWRADPLSFLRQRGLNIKSSPAIKQVYVLIVEAFLFWHLSDFFFSIKLTFQYFHTKK
uniref:Nicotinamide riboside kinase 1 n=1 Tax=Nothobranchius furzeri TaxID=105023 RepID=A0A8C6LRH3_NOTFU